MTHKALVNIPHNIRVQAWAYWSMLGRSPYFHLLPPNTSRTFLRFDKRLHREVDPLGAICAAAGRTERFTTHQAYTRILSELGYNVKPGLIAQFVGDYDAGKIPDVKEALGV